MTFEKGNFKFSVNRIGGISIGYRKFGFDIGLFRSTIYTGHPLFSIKLFNWIKEMNTLQIFCIDILRFTIDIFLDFKKTGLKKKVIYKEE